MGIIPQATFTDNWALKKIFKYIFYRAELTVALLIILTTNTACGLGSAFNQGTPTSTNTSSVTNTLSSRADLIVEDVTVETVSSMGCPTSTTPLQMRVKIYNQGEAESGPFVVQVANTLQSLPSGLAAGSWFTLIFPGYESEPEIMVDATFLVAEEDETNNRLKSHLPTPTLPAECQVTPTPQIEFEPAKLILEGHKNKVWSVAFSPSGSLIASGSVDNSVLFWQADTGQPLRTWGGHPFPITSLKFSPNGTSLATGSTDGKIRLWRISDGTLLRQLDGHAGWITSLDYSSDNLLLASSSDDFTIRLWRLPNGRPVQVIDEGMAEVNSVIFSPDSKSIFWGEADGSVRQRSINGEWLQYFQQSTISANRVALSTDGRWLAAGFEDGAIRIWSLESGEMIQSLRSHNWGITGIEFSPDGNFLVSAAKDGSLRLWQWQETGFLSKPVRIYIGHTGPVNDLDISPAGDLIVSGSDDGTVRIWEVPQAANP